MTYKHDCQMYKKEEKGSLSLSGQEKLQGSANRSAAVSSNLFDSREMVKENIAE